MKKIWRHTWCYKTYDVIRNYIQYRKDKSLIGGTLYSNEFALVLKKYLKLDVRKDWLGRLYGIINPTINSNGDIDITSTIIEIDGDETNSNVYTQIWVYKQLELIKNLFNIHKLYDYINVNLTHVGPITQDNYLIVFDIVSRSEFAKSLKRWFKITILYLLIAAAIVLPLVLTK